MSRRALSPRRDTSDGNDWMTTYSDAITLLLAFFVMLISVAQIDEGKFEQLKQGWGQTSQGNTEQESQPKTTFATDVEGVEVQQLEQRIEIEIANEHLYDTGSAQLKDSTIPLLEQLAEEIQSFTQNDLHNQNRMISVEGHTDDVPIQSAIFASNWELSATRATTVTRKLIELGIDPNHIQAVGFADTRPKVGTTGEFSDKQRQLNRRVVIAIYQ
ncbi:OmpA/MotB family protein [Vibrio agarivorans]|uniref:Flagellar motor protein MotB n=1 Tax=Vibrio agarivorans TaxID=153622 RepID=A0ABT7XXP8_9VIBR|nr:flagellar motor protein MotB [Vibrio agarivorans]MDN2480540.1 flagellar motor protein MotB [Vibrio agarivorans]